MKKLTLIALITSSFHLIGQDTFTPKNEIGVDITSIFGEIFGYRNYYYDYYPPYYYNYSAPKYYLNYRRKLAKGNLRLGVGGSFGKNNTGVYYSTDSSIKQSTSSMQEINLRIGYEVVKYFSKKWAVYGGIDFRPSMSQSNTKSIYPINYYSITDTKGFTLGFAPFIGLRYNVHPRISLTIEGNCLLRINNTHSVQSFEPITSTTPAKSPIDYGTETRSSFNFTQPFSLTAAYRF